MLTPKHRLAKYSWKVARRPQDYTIDPRGRACARVQAKGNGIVRRNNSNKNSTSQAAAVAVQWWKIKISSSISSTHCIKDASSRAIRSYVVRIRSLRRLRSGAIAVIASTVIQIPPSIWAATLSSSSQRGLSARLRRTATTTIRSATRNWCRITSPWTPTDPSLTIICSQSNSIASLLKLWSRMITDKWDRIIPHSSNSWYR